MRIIISPAKTMEVDNDDFIKKTIPVFIKEAEMILNYLKKLHYQELKAIWKSSDKLAQLNFERIRNMDLYNNLSPAIISFKGLQYNYMGPGVFTLGQLDYIQKHLRILSGFYGVLKPFDGVTPYRLEMQAKLLDYKYNNLYNLWNSKIAENVFAETNTIIDLASKEYSRVISTYLNHRITMIEIVFGELINGKIVEKATYAKMARGEMVRFMAENSISREKDIKYFDRLGYTFSQELSKRTRYVFIKE